MTTIEYCERKTLRKVEADDNEKTDEKNPDSTDGSSTDGTSWLFGSSSSNPTYQSPYDINLYHNLKCVLGRNPLFWLFPVAADAGDGLRFECRSDLPLVKKHLERASQPEEHSHVDVGDVVYAVVTDDGTILTGSAADARRVGEVDLSHSVGVEYAVHVASESEEEGEEGGEGELRMVAQQEQEQSSGAIGRAASPHGVVGQKHHDEDEPATMTTPGRGGVHLHRNNSTSFLGPNSPNKSHLSASSAAFIDASPRTPIVGKSPLLGKSQAQHTTFSHPVHDMPEDGSFVHSSRARHPREQPVTGPCGGGGAHHDLEDLADFHVDDNPEEVVPEQPRRILTKEVVPASEEIMKDIVDVSSWYYEQVAESYWLFWNTLHRSWRAAANAGTAV